MQCQSLNDCFGQIKSYTDRDATGYPLLVHTENFDDTREIVQRLEADTAKTCVRVSEHTLGNGLPNLQAITQIVRQEGSYVLIGLSQALMLAGEAKLDEMLDAMIGLSVPGHVIVLLSHCHVLLDKYLQRDLRLERRIVFLAGAKTPLPKLRIARSKAECFFAFDDGIQALLAHLERLSDREENLCVVTNFSQAFFRHSMYRVSQSGGIFDAVAQKFPEPARAGGRQLGTDDNWAWLLKNAGEATSFAALIAEKFGSATDLSRHLRDCYDSGDKDLQWLLWLGMKVLGCGTNGYLALVLGNTAACGDFIHHAYCDLLEIDKDDARFETFFRERKALLADLPEQPAEIRRYCENVGRHGRDAVRYLTDATQDEEYAFMKLMADYAWTGEEMAAAIAHAFPELSKYLQDFTFDALNTKLTGQDAPLRDTLTDYFARYKRQKLCNRIDDDFLARVDEFAVQRPFYKLQPRSAIVSAMDKRGVQAYFFDALGAEYLGYIQAKCEQYGLVCKVDIAHCELPSITVKNKEFQQHFRTRDISDLDELKHHSQSYDYRTCPYPIHIFRELEIIDRELRNMRAGLVQHSFERAVILSDHGASRLAVIYGHESAATLELEEKGRHSGRCCPCEADPQLAQAAYEDGYAVLGNYERFKGSRKANLEVHGGASLEEVVVPIITLSLKPDKLVYHFVQNVLKIKSGQAPVIELFCNTPMKAPKLEIEGRFYEGKFTADRNHAVFELSDLKRARSYEAAIYDSDANTGVTLTFTLERGTKTIDLFGLK